MKKKIYKGCIRLIEHGLFELNEYDQGVNIWLGIIGRRPGE